MQLRARKRSKSNKENIQTQGPARGIYFRRLINYVITKPAKGLTASHFSFHA